MCWLCNSPRNIQAAIDSFFVVACFLTGALMYLFHEKQYHRDNRADFFRALDKERRTTFSILLVLPVPFWALLRFGVTRALLTKHTFYLYTNAVAAAFLSYFVAYGALVGLSFQASRSHESLAGTHSPPLLTTSSTLQFVRYGAAGEHPNDWLVRSVISVLIFVVPLLSRQHMLSVLAQSILAAFATEIVCYLSLNEVGYKCDCYDTFITSNPAVIFTHAIYWIVVMLAACESVVSSSSFSSRSAAHFSSSIDSLFV